MDKTIMLLDRFLYIFIHSFMKLDSLIGNWTNKKFPFACFDDCGTKRLRQITSLSCIQKPLQILWWKCLKWGTLKKLATLSFFQHHLSESLVIYKNNASGLLCVMCRWNFHYRFINGNNCLFALNKSFADIIWRSPR